MAAERYIYGDMAEPVIISWNVPNWITIFLMASLGYFVFAAGYKVWKSRQQKAA